MTVLAIRCSECGGTIAHAAKDPVPRCLFCDSDALEEVAEESDLESPEVWIPFSLDENDGKKFFREWAGRSIWYPSDLRHARLDIHRIMLPAWVWDGRLETHWAALVPSATKSGKRPISGRDDARFTGVLIPSSTALSRKELADISPFGLDNARNLSDSLPELPFEVGGVSRVGSRTAAIAGMKGRHLSELSDRVGANRIRGAILDHEMKGRPVLLPVFIGAFRRKDTFYRIIINGQTGAISGTAPLSWVKIFTALGVLGLLVFLLLWVVSS